MKKSIRGMNKNKKRQKKGFYVKGQFYSSKDISRACQLVAKSLTNIISSAVYSAKLLSDSMANINRIRIGASLVQTEDPKLYEHFTS